ncbi:hypothetical protein ILUMI_20096 [Ignelater luminosus]|uniref:PDZ domain-containing protein n=1 Tax=Ignelater luminosus TaxID=2038154 RepID=A0A8K0G2L1_IGNLU|nr:hypothetical protein ILUMI_20096 [Ignelater luminosus]
MQYKSNTWRLREGFMVSKFEVSAVRRRVPVNPGSKAAVKGVREGDIITSINNQPTRDISNADAHILLKKSGDTLKLGLNEDCRGSSPKRRQYNKTIQQETHSESIERSSLSKSSYSTSTSVTINRNQSDSIDTENSNSVRTNGQVEKNGE